MQKSSSPTRYPPAYTRLHWLIAALIISLFSMQYIRRPFGEEAHAIVREMHKSLGLVLIGLIVLRLAMRMFHPMPARFPDLSRLRMIGAHLVHVALWGMMLIVPAMGVAFLLARGRGVEFFELVQIPPLTTGSIYWGDVTITLHRYAAFVLIGLVTLHAAAALFHRFVLKDTLMSRMTLRRTQLPGDLHSQRD